MGIKFFNNHHKFLLENYSFSIRDYFLDKSKILFSFLSMRISSLFYRDRIFIHDNVTDIKKTLKILLSSKFKISFYILVSFLVLNLKRHQILLKKKRMESFLFQDICSQLLEKYLPFSYDFNSINNIKILKIKKGTILITKSLSSPDNINFRLFLAENIENLKVYSLQHGGGYGYLKNFYLENYEKSISKKIFNMGLEKR